VGAPDPWAGFAGDVKRPGGALRAEAVPRVERRRDLAEQAPESVALLGRDAVGDLVVLVLSHVVDVTAKTAPVPPVRPLGGPGVIWT
jgi:hypothetical protein